jgi:predicted HTH transcriptional regulator
VSWRDEYLKWICGFANANGASIFIGKDNKGNVLGVTDSIRLLKKIVYDKKTIIQNLENSFNVSLQLLNELKHG